MANLLALQKALNGMRMSLASKLILMIMPLPYFLMTDAAFLQSLCVPKKPVSMKFSLRITAKQKSSKS
ncbi:MAG TPA: hypothetical protein VIO64_09505 [Pseudobacteroides sp.]|uniref:hypothetical protein n=1 Tax=Pseudobacteroides sp. TaxID=1968840 RepID=UPI002F945F59